MNRVYVSLGSNIEKEKNLVEAVRLLDALCSLLDVSSVYETVPVGLIEQPNFWNAAALLETEHDALAFRREVLRQIESTLNRVRLNNPNAPRTIDADLTLFNQDIFDLDESHHIPDPDLLRFPHVAVPIAEISPEFRHPETGEQLGEIARRLMQSSEEEGKQALWIRPDVVIGAKR